MPRNRLLGPGLALAALPIFACEDSTRDSADVVVSQIDTTSGPKLTAEPMRPLGEDMFPCSECHATSKAQADEEGLLEPNEERREVTDPHDVIEFTHDAANRWCLDCHDAWNRDSLRLANGRLLGLRESPGLCGQCHGARYRDWKVGAHGRRTGEWRSSGQKSYFHCVNCHDPHAPQIKKIQPRPAPLPPGGH